MQRLPYLRLVGITGLAIVLGACSSTQKAADVTGNVRDALKQAGFTDVSVDQDRDKGVVTLKGNVPSEDEKLRAEGVARTTAQGQVIADEIAVRPPGEESTAKKIDSDLDKGIEKNVDAALIQSGLHDQVKYDVNKGVVTLTGDVQSEDRRAAAQSAAAAVPNVQQVVNKIEVKNQRASSTR
jgi:hyperosmotically inducible periplasmic protein